MRADTASSWVTGELWGEESAGAPDRQREAGRMSPPGKDPQPAVSMTCTLCQGIRHTCLGLKWGPPPEPLLGELKQHMTVY